MSYEPGNELNLYFVLAYSNIESSPFIIICVSSSFKFTHKTVLLFNETIPHRQSRTQPGLMRSLTSLYTFYKVVLLEVLGAKCPSFPLALMTGEPLYY